MNDDIGPTPEILPAHLQISNDQKGRDATSATFSYAGLDPEVAGEVRAALAKIEGASRRILGDVILIGNELIAVKTKLGRVRFTHWLLDQFPWGERTGRRYIRVAELMGDKTDTVSDLPMKAIYKLAETSAEIREPIIERMGCGENFTAEKIDQFLFSARQETKAAATVAKQTPSQRRTKEKRESERRRAVAEAEQRDQAIERLAEAGAAIIRQKFSDDRGALEPYVGYAVWSRIGSKLGNEPKPEKAPNEGAVIDLPRLRDDGPTGAAYGLPSSPSVHEMTRNGSHVGAPDSDAIPANPATESTVGS
jgi:hypothetical protein